MRKDYQTTHTITTLQQKTYLLSLIQDEDLQYQISLSMTSKQLKDIVKNNDQKIYQLAVHYLYQAQNFDELEERLIMMNFYFDNHDYQNIKKDLFDKLVSHEVTLDEYCVLRQLVPHFQLFDFLQYLQKHTYISIMECAKICLIEDHHQLAYQYLSQLDDCDNEKVMDLLCSYSVLDYLALKRQYKRNKKGWVLQPLH